MDLNKVQIIGNVTQDIEVKQTPNGQNVCTISVATNRNWVDGSGNKQELAEFHSVVLWGKVAEIAGKFLQKGKKVYIEGRLQTRSWEAQDGTKRYKTEIVGENLILLDSKNGGEVGATQGYTNQSTNKSNAVSTKNDVKKEEISIEDIPF